MPRTGIARAAISEGAVTSGIRCRSFLHRQATTFDRSSTSGSYEMARRSCTFKQQDVTRALRGAIAAGIEIKRVEIDTAGKIVIVATDLSPQTSEHELNLELAAFKAARHGQG
jgi:hypothetical protein